MNMQLKNQSHSKDIVDDVEGFIKQCTLLMAQQQICIAHACSSLGVQSLSSMWLSRPLDNIDELGLSDAKVKTELMRKAKANIHICSLIKRDNEFKGKRSCALDRISLYEGGLSVFVGGYNDNPRLLVHVAFALLQKGLQASALGVFQKITHIYDSPEPPRYYDEFLHTIDAAIIIQVEDGDMDGAIREMHRRVDAVSKWVGNGLGLANDLYRLGSFYSLSGRHEQCAKHLEKSLHVGTGLDEYDETKLACIKLLATTYDALNDTRAVNEYVCAQSMEKNITNKARLINALSHFLITVDGESRLAVDYLDNCMNILHGESNDESTNPNILLDTMILYGDAMASEAPSSAIDWYNLALRSNPDKSTINPTNLRALSNKGN